MTILSRVWDMWIDRPGLDWLAAAIIAFIGTRFHVWEYVEIREHGAFYQTAASTSLGLLSLGGVAVTLLVTVPQSDRLKKALSQAGDGLVSLMFTCLFGLIISTVLFVALFGLDTGSFAAIRCVVFLVATSITILCSMRLMWLLQRILSLLV